MCIGVGQVDQRCNVGQALGSKNHLASRKCNGIVSLGPAFIAKTRAHEREADMAFGVHWMGPSELVFHNSQLPLTRFLERIQIANMGVVDAKIVERDRKP